MDADNTEQVAIVDLVEGDVVLHPVRQMWMRVVRLETLTETIHHNDRGEKRSETPRSLRQITLDPVHREKFEMFIPYYLDYRDMEQFDMITRWTGGDLPTQRY